MIRLSTPRDAPELVRLAVGSALFAVEDAPVVETSLAEYFGGGNTNGHVCIIATEEPQGPVGAAQHEPATATTECGARPCSPSDRPSAPPLAGLGLRYVEDELLANQQRIPLV